MSPSIAGAAYQTVDVVSVDERADRLDLVPPGESLDSRNSCIFARCPRSGRASCRGRAETVCWIRGSPRRRARRSCRLRSAMRWTRNWMIPSSPNCENTWNSALAISCDARVATRRLSSPPICARSRSRSVSTAARMACGRLLARRRAGCVSTDCRAPHHAQHLLVRSNSSRKAMTPSTYASGVS